MTLDILTIMVASSTAFVASSMDNLLLLIGFKAAPRLDRRSVSAGYVLSVVIVTGLAWALALAAEGRTPFRLSYLGVLPILAGVHHGFRSLRERASSEGAPPPERGSGFLSVLVTMLANSGDSLLVLMALFADTTPGLDGIAGATLIAMSVLWIRIAVYVAGHPRHRGRVEAFARYALPFILVAVGVYILMDTPTDLV
jgi:cadmium resistance protein CadD (predicted permease)